MWSDASLIKPQGQDSKVRTMSEMGGGVAANAALPSAKEIRTLKETVQDLQKQLQEMSFKQEHLTRQVDGQRQMSHAISQPAIHSDLMYMQDGASASQNPYATLPHNIAKEVLLQQLQQPQQSPHTYPQPYAPQLDHQSNIYQSPNQQIPFCITQQQ
ncbi:unnamed protein product, partial [Anisakis simplex]|uniref:LOB domain-containing protein n=1 Tax=Anisakis simplex TaxID=6269 RepID=A0A0M3JBC7_ANISI